MDVTLQKHGAKHIYKVPEGLRELCTDISREVLRSQPADLYAFIAEYVDTLLITRENTKVAVKVVNNILLGSQAILCILYRTGFTLEQIAVAAPRIQKAFREYLDAVDMQPGRVGEDSTCDENSMVSIRGILEATGSTRKDAEKAATVIQAAFRGHYERMAVNEARGKVQWQRAVTNTMDILRKAGATQEELSKAARHVKFAYRGYYIRRNQRIDVPEEEEDEKRNVRILEPVEAIQAVAWMEMMYEDSGLTVERANEAATIIQRAYKMYRARTGRYEVQQLESTKSMVVDAIIDTLHHKVFEKVTSRGNIPEEYGTREELISTSAKVQLAFKEHYRMTRVTKEVGHLEPDETDEEEEEAESMDDEETLITDRSPDFEQEPSEPEARSETERAGEQWTEAETDEQQASEAEFTADHLPTSPELQSEPETEYPTEAELEEDDEEARGTKENEEEQLETEEERNVAQETGTGSDAPE